MRKSIEAFEFEHDGRTYICTPEARAGGKKEMWWWFRVSGDAQRYAPFEVVAGESKDAVAEAQGIEQARCLFDGPAPAPSRDEQRHRRVLRRRECRQQVELLKDEAQVRAAEEHLVALRHLRSAAPQHLDLTFRGIQQPGNN